MKHIKIAITYSCTQQAKIQEEFLQILLWVIFSYKGFYNYGLDNVNYDYILRVHDTLIHYN